MAPLLRAAWAARAALVALAASAGATACITPSFDAPPSPHAGEGTLTIEPSRVTASSHHCFLFRYRPGPAGLFAGGGIRVRLPADPVHLWMGFSPPQAEVGDKRGYVICQVRREGNFVRWGRALALEGSWAACLLESGRLADDEELVLGYWTLAPRASGIYPVEAEARPTGGWGGRALPDVAPIEVVAAPARVLRAIGPSEVAPGAPFEMAVVALDEFGNRAASPAAPVEIAIEDRTLPVPFAEEGKGIALLPDLRVMNEGFHWPRLRWEGEAGLPHVERVHPIRCLPEGAARAGRVLWGSVEDRLDPAAERYAREVSRLDFSGPLPADLPAMTIYSWRNRGSAYVDDVFRLEPDERWLSLALPHGQAGWALVAGSGGAWGRPGLDDETALEPGHGGLTAIVAEDGSPGALRSAVESGEVWATTGERIYLSAIRRDAEVTIVAAGTAPLARVELVVVEPSGRRIVPAAGVSGPHWQGSLPIPAGSDRRLAFVRVVQEDGEAAWSRAWRLDGTEDVE